MPNTYNKMTIQAFFDKVESLKKQEERGLRIENQFSTDNQSSLIRQISIEVYGDILGLINEHFKLAEEAPKRRGGRKPGTKNRAKVESQSNQEVAASSEE